MFFGYAERDLNLSLGDAKLVPQHSQNPLEILITNYRFNNIFNFVDQMEPHIKKIFEILPHQSFVIGIE